jgi:hypothetical protein
VNKDDNINKGNVNNQIINDNDNNNNVEETQSNKYNNIPNSTDSQIVNEKPSIGKSLQAKKRNNPKSIIEDAKRYLDIVDGASSGNQNSNNDNQSIEKLNSNPSPSPPPATTTSNQDNPNPRLNKKRFKQPSDTTTTTTTAAADGHVAEGEQDKSKDKIKINAKQAHGNNVKSNPGLLPAIAAPSQKSKASREGGVIGHKVESHSAPLPEKTEKRDEPLRHE